MPKPIGISGVFTVAVLGLGAVALAGAVTAAERDKWIVDESSGCGTSNPFPSPDESIKWFGGCKDGRLHGSGTLIWYRGKVEAERNDGTFKDGELQGEAIIAYPDGHVIVGQYNAGRRHGRFITIKPNRAHVEASYRNGKLTSQRTLGPQEVAAWKRERAARLAASLPKGTPRLAEAAPRAAAPRPQPAAPRAAAPRPQPATPRAAAPRPATPRPPPAAQPQSLAWAGAAPPRSAPRAARSAQWAQPSPASASRTLTRTANGGAASNGSAAAIPARPVASPRGIGVAPRRTARFAGKPVRGRPSATELARYYAGTDSVATGYQRPVARPPAAFAPPVLRPPNGTRKPLVVAAPQDAAEADRLFTNGYQSERAGRFFEAEQIYERILMQFPSAQSAVLANTRLDALRNRNGADGAPGGTFYADRGTRSGGARVVAVNAPNPVRQGGGRGSRVDRESLYKESADIGRRVCTVDGLYEDGARWCGVVVRDESSHFRVEVRRVELPGFGTVGIGRSTCTGNTFINWFSRGASVRVPKQCLAFHG